MDAMDNLYVVLEGSKDFYIAPPSEALYMKTVSPSYAVSPDGLSYQFNANKYRSYLQQAQTQSQSQARADAITSKLYDAANHTNAEFVIDQASIVATPINNSPGSGESSVKDRDFESLLDDATTTLLHSNVSYSLSHAHFSKLTFPSSSLSTSLTSKMDSSTPQVKTSKFTIRAGEILYLPTGWFHQVTSASGKHVAINYWWRALHWQSAVAFELKKSRSLYEKLSNTVTVMH